MIRVSAKRMIEWADNPPEWHYSRYAYSQDDLEDLKEQSVTDRRSFLLNAAVLEVGRRGARLAEISTAETMPEEFQVPRRPTLTLKDCEAVAAIHTYHRVMAGERPGWDVNTLKFQWRNLADDYASLNGFARDTHKFSDGMYVKQKPHPRFHYTEQQLIDGAEDDFERRWEWANGYATKGFNLHFMMAGVAKIDDACLDVSSLERMLADQRKRKDETYFSKDEITFWQNVINASREFDNDGPFSRKKRFGDMVDEIGPGVYSAPYIDPAVISSRRYVTLDDWHRAGLLTDESHTVQKLTRGFNDIVELLTTKKKWEHSYYSAQNPLNRHGATFFRKSQLLAVAEMLDWKRNGKHLKDIVDFLVQELYEDDDDQLDEERTQVMLGTTQLSRTAILAAQATFRAGN